MAEEAVTIHQGHGTLAQTIMANAPDGMLIAPAWKRAVAYVFDILLISLILQVVTGFIFLQGISSIYLVLEGVKSAAYYFVNWFIFISANYLYFKYTGKTMGRSLAQRSLRIAIVHDNGSALDDHHWGPRAFSKLIYIIPFVGALWFGFRDTIRAQSKNAEYRTSIDIKNHTVAAVDWSLPSETRLKLH
jgi:uncharacterized RDD family membrane protein YckC